VGAPSLKSVARSPTPPSSSCGLVASKAPICDGIVLAACRRFNSAMPALTHTQKITFGEMRGPREERRRHPAGLPLEQAAGRGDGLSSNARPNDDRLHVGVS